MTSSFFGLPTGKIGNENITLEYLTNAGPRIVRLFIDGFEGNFLGEFPEARIETSVGTYWIRGGHRLWHSPEANPRTYIPDDDNLIITEIENGVSLHQPVEPISGIEKNLEILVLKDEASVVINHCLTNRNPWPVELAPWAITQLPMGGTAILPNHSKPVDEHRLLPNRQLVLWPYTQWTDSRLHFTEDSFLIDAKPSLPPVKIGYFNKEGWAGYYQNGTLMIKTIKPIQELVYPDFGCNVECYCNDVFIELETLGPLEKLQPGQSVTHQEKWDFLTQLNSLPSIQDIESLMGNSPR